MRLLALGLFLSVFASLASCSSGTAACSSSTCQGCCDSTGTCQAGTSDTVCGGAGVTCSACATGQTCTAKACTGTATGGGQGGGSGGGTATGGSGATGGGSGATGGGSGATGGSGGSSGGGNAGVGGGGFSFTTPHVQIDFPQNCPDAPCGGSLDGTYFYTSACIPMTEFTPFVAQLEQVCGSGSTHIDSVDGGMTGYAVVAGTAVLRSVQGSVTVSASVTGQCVQGCSLLSGGISQGGYTGSCFVDAGSCDCNATKAIAIADNGQFVKNGNDLTIVGSGKTFDYCVSGTTVTTHEIDAGTSAHEPGVATLTHQN